MVAVFDYNLLKQRKKVCFQPVAASPPIPQGGNNHLTQIRGNQTTFHSWEKHTSPVGRRATGRRNERGTKMKMRVGKENSMVCFT